jgi:oligopeptide transport system ATP-binding protein
MILSVKNLHISLRTWGKKISALQGVEFHLKKGEILGIVGESGCGKSMTAKAIMGLLPLHAATVEQGEIIYLGKDLLSFSEAEMRSVRGREIAMVFQDPMTSLNPTKRVGNQITEGLLLHHPHLKKREAEARAINLLSSVGIAQPELRFRAYPHTLSGGMRQRAMIALAMACDPKILLADEPTTALDVTVQAQILELLKEIARTRNTSIILITHDLSVVARLCDRVLVMYAGKIVEEAEVEELFCNPSHPYTKKLLQSIPRIDSPRGTPLYPIKGRPPLMQQCFNSCPFAPRCEDARPICHEKMPPKIELKYNHFVSCWKCNNE